MRHLRTLSHSLDKFGLTGRQTYTSVIGIFSLNGFWGARLATRHMNAILLVSWIVFAYRDLWPLATFTLSPVDASEGPILWTKIGALTLGAVIVPLVIPREYVPYTLKVASHLLETTYIVDNPYQDSTIEPSPEQTASILSRMFVAFLDPLIWSASRRSHTTLEELPSLCDIDSMNSLDKRCVEVYQYLYISAPPLLMSALAIRSYKAQLKTSHFLDPHEYLRSVLVPSHSTRCP